MNWTSPSDEDAPMGDMSCPSKFCKKILHLEHLASTGFRCALIQTIALVLLFSVRSFGQAAAPFMTGEPPDWVEGTAAEPELPAGSGQEASGQVFILFDTQVNVAKSETYLHVVKQITDQTGVQNGANLEFGWDPSFQNLTIHQVSIRRGSNHLNRLDPTKFKVIQQETDLSRHIYNGTLSAVLFLDDVRVGDQIETAYTLRGANPSLQGRYAEVFGLGWAVAIEHRRVRILSPTGHPLNFRVHGTAAQPEVQVRGGTTQRVWDVRRLRSAVVEDQVPSWFVAYPLIQVSEFVNWEEIATWMAGLYVTTNLAATELQEKIASLRRPQDTSEQTVQRALEFTQNEIRYLGIEFGPHSYRPTDPVTVLQRRFGDCKDKAFVLCTLLRGLGYEATPVLVSTGIRHTLPDYLPAPQDFDHVIVRVVAEGVTYWLDPTRAYQRGPLTRRYRPAYGYGLLVRAGETELTSIPVIADIPPETVTSEVFHVGEQRSSAQLNVTTTYKGFDAEWMRAIFADIGPERLAKSLLNDYAQYYPGISPRGDIRIDDSPNTDSVSITHNYAITNFWVLAADKEKFTCQFYPLGIHTWLTKPATTIRSMPMELSFPRRRVVQTRIELPTEFRISNATNNITGPAAELKIGRAYHSLTVWLNYEYNALTNFIPTSLTAEHVSSLALMENALGYSLDWQNMDRVNSTSQFNWPIFSLALVFTGVLIVSLASLYRRQTNTFAVRAASPRLDDHELEGLGGWLVLVGLGLVLGLLRTSNEIVRSLGSFSLWKWRALTHPGGMSYHPGWRPLLSLELLSEITLLVLNVFVVMLFFQKRWLFPRWCIVFWVLTVACGIADTVGLQLVKPYSEFSRDFSRSLIPLFTFGFIWIPYMCRSRRVKATFVR